MHTILEQLMRWLGEPEGLRLEFKEAKNRYDFDKLVDYCVALANEGGRVGSWRSKRCLNIAFI